MSLKIGAFAVHYICELFRQPFRSWRPWRASALGMLSVLPLVLSGTAHAQSLTWVKQGPGPNTLGQVEKIADREVVGAIQAVAPHPTDANIVYVGAVNGGLWKTTNAMSASPTWQRMGDDSRSLSMGALEFDPTEMTHRTLVAGSGRFSSFALGGALDGLRRTVDGGATWTAIDGGGALRNLNITGVAPRGPILVVSAVNAGIVRSTDTGATWTPISGGTGTGLPAGQAFDLASDPTDSTRLFANAGANGIYRSTDSGATWTKVSNPAIEGLMAGALSNVRIAVGTSNNVYVAIARARRLAGLFRSGDGGTTWTTLDLPTTIELGVPFGLHPGGQARIHFSIAADPGEPNIVYLGGDRQPSFAEAGGPNFPVPNSLGARDYSGRLFRVDASRPSGSQVEPLTHSGTASGSSPHADSRDMDVAVNGMLIEVNDGGIYHRTSPRTRNGDWFSMNGDIQTAEFHSAAWDANSDIVIAGAQDTGTPEQITAAGARWRSVSTADGSIVAVDDTSTPGLSTRYSSSQNLGGFRRRVVDSANVVQSEDFPKRIVLGGGEPLVPQFYTPIKLNAVDARRLVFGGGNLFDQAGGIVQRGAVYESLDQGDTITQIQPSVVVNASGPIAYGAAGNPDILYVGSGNQVFVRAAASPAPLVASATYPGTEQVMGIAVDPGDPLTAYVVDTAAVYRTADAGATWTEITGNLRTLTAADLLTAAYSTSLSHPGVLVASSDGVFLAAGPGFSSWLRLGTGLPKALVLSLEYDAADDILVAATLGQGAWTLRFGH